MSTKLKGDIAEQAAILQALEHGFGVLRPVGDRLPYDLVFDVDNSLVKIQVKHAWHDVNRDNYVIDNRRTKTNRRQMVRSLYIPGDFDFALAYVAEFNVFYVFPVEVFIDYGSEIHLVEIDKRQRKPRSADYRNAWNLISHWAASRETLMRSPVKFGETLHMAIPSQAPQGEGVET